ncbi:phage tail protein [Citrobacter freundii]
MSQTAITLVFEQWKAQQAATGEPVLLDEFVFALVPGLDPSLPVERSETLPPTAQIVHREPVTRKGVVNENAVVHSAVLGADVGDFSFNWIGLANKASGTLAMIVHAPEQQKLKTKEGQQGNVLTRSFLMEYTGAQSETGINTPAETWQIDFTARMAGMDERQRLENIDIYGAAAFFGDGWLVSKTGNQYFVTKGAGYVAGLRAVLAANQNIIVTTMPVKVWLDVCWTGTLTSTWSVQSKVTVAASLEDYEQNGVKHYVFALASIDANGNITDLRPKGSLDNQQGNNDYVRKDANLSDVKDKAKSRVNLGLKGASILDVGKVQGTVAAGDDERIVNALQSGKNLSDVADKVKSRDNLGLKSAAVADVQESQDDTTKGRILLNGSAIALRLTRANSTGGEVKDFNDLPSNAVSFGYASAAHSPGYEASILDFSGLHGDYNTQLAMSYSTPGVAKFRTQNGDKKIWSEWTSFLTSIGGSIAYVEGAKYYKTSPSVWEGGGAYSNQWKNNAAPFLIPNGYASPRGQSFYLPIVKGMSQTEVIGYGSAVSFGILRSGNLDFGQAVIHLIGDNGSSGAMYLDINSNLTVAGQVAPGNFGNFDARYFTQSAANAKFVSGVRLGASSVFQERSNNERMNGGVMTSWQDAGSSNYWIRLRQIQYFIESIGWVNVAYV